MRRNFLLLSITNNHLSSRFAPDDHSSNVDNIVFITNDNNMNNESAPNNNFDATAIAHKIEEDT